MGHVGRSLGLYFDNLQLLWGMLDGAWGCMLATYSSYGACWTEFGAVCWQPTGLMEHVGRSLGLYVGNLQVLWGMLDGAWGCVLTTYSSYGACWTEFGAVCWQPTSSYGACWTEFGAVCWQPTALMGHVGRSLGLCVGNLQVFWGMLDRAWGCMLAPMGHVGRSLRLYVGNLLEGAWGYTLATCSSYGACWTELGALCWQPTCLLGHVGRSLGLYVGNLQLLWGMLDGAWGCMLATYMSFGACWTEFGAVCWQPVGRRLALYVGNLQLLWAELGAIRWQPAALMGHVGRSLGLYVGNLQVSWGMLDGVWGCMLATYSSYGACWTELGAVCWQPTCLMGHVGRSLGLYVGNLQLLWGMLDGVWGCVLATYRSYGACWTEFGAVCWQPTGLMGHVGRSLGLCFDNLQLLWGMLDGVWGCMLATCSSNGACWTELLATYRSYGVCWTELGAVCWQPTALMTEFGAVCWQPTGLMGHVGRTWGCVLATYRSYGACWTELGAVCWQPTALMGHVGPSLGLYFGNLQVLWGMLDGAWGCMLGTCSSNGACWTELGAVCWQRTRLMGHVGRSLGLYVGNLQVLWGMLDGVWGCMLATYSSYGACWTELGAVCWQPTGLMGHVGNLHSSSVHIFKRAR